jgi:hypothetical protein
VSKASRVVVLVGALAVSVNARAADVHEIDLEGYLVPPGRARLDAPVPPAAALPEDAAFPRVPATTLPPSLSLVWIDAGGAATGSERSARDEAQRLLRALGVAATWRTGRPSEPVRPGELRVILLDRGAVDATGAPVLGATPDHFDGEPFFWVHVPSVRSALGLDPRRPLAPTELRDRHQLGVAIGRVVAHESVHALAPGVPHGVGLMAARLTRGDLLAKAVPLQPELGIALRAALVGRGEAGAGGAAAGRLLTVGADAARR